MTHHTTSASYQAGDSAVFFSAAAEGVTYTLPASPADGCAVSVFNVITANEYTIVISGNGNAIDCAADGGTLAEIEIVAGRGVILCYCEAAGRWGVIAKS